MSCTECQKRMHFNSNGLEPKGREPWVRAAEAGAPTGRACPLLAQEGSTGRAAVTITRSQRGSVTLPGTLILPYLTFSECSGRSQRPHSSSCSSRYRLALCSQPGSSGKWAPAPELCCSGCLGLMLASVSRQAPRGCKAPLDLCAPLDLRSQASRPMGMN